MADEQNPGGSEAPPPAQGGAAGDPPKPAADAPKAAPPKPAAPAAHAPPKPPAVMAAVPWDSDLTHELKERFGSQITETSSYLGQDFIVCKPEAAIPILEFLKLEA